MLADSPPTEFPALWDQIEHPEDWPDLTGRRVLDATPCWRNTLPKYLALLAAGADVSVSPSGGIPHDPHVVAALPQFGIQVVDPRTERGFDAVLDCAGRHVWVPSRLGYVELTRSGVEPYRNCRQPVLLVDVGTVKLIEDALGTGDGFVRAMAHLGHPVLAGAGVLVVGAGKVGAGIARRCREAGAVVTVVDDPAVPPPFGCEFVDRFDRDAVVAAIRGAWCVVTATGAAAALAPLASVLRSSSALLANMGATDEFGPDLPAARVLLGKAPVNFALPEPTRLRYLDPSLALSNAGVGELASGRVAPGLSAPAALLEERVLRPVRQYGAVAAEVAALLDR